MRTATVRILTALTAAAVLVTSGCASSREVSTPAPTTMPATAPPAATVAPGSDLPRLLISPTDIALPGFRPPAVRPLDEDAVAGIAAFFDSEGGERQLGITIVLLPDAAAARTAAQGAASTTRDQRPGATSAPATVGDQAMIITGYQQDRTASTMLLFSQGSASVAMDFRSPATDPTAAEAVIETGARQAALLKPAYG